VVCFVHRQATTWFVFVFLFAASFVAHIQLEAVVQKQAGHRSAFTTTSIASARHE
jgi:hypothetical protein